MTELVLEVDFESSNGPVGMGGSSDGGTGGKNTEGTDGSTDIDGGSSKREIGTPAAVTSVFFSDAYLAT